MRVYHEHLRVPAYWWPLGFALVALFGAELVAGFPWLLAASAFGLLIVATAAALLLSGRTAVEVWDRELRAGRAWLPLDCAGEVAALDESQTRLLRGPRADPRAFVLTRPYLKRAVYIEITGSCPGGPSRAAPRRWWHRAGGGRRRSEAMPPQGPYWLVGSRQPEQLAAAIGKSRPVARPDDVPVG
jgi:hypothetical protein